VPNTTQASAGRIALLMAYADEAHLLERVGFGRVLETRTAGQGR